MIGVGICYNHKMDRYESFDDYYQSQSKVHQQIIEKLRGLVTELSPSLQETVKWGNGCWANTKLPVMFVHCKDDHVQFGFYGGALLSDPDKLLKGGGQYVRHVPLARTDDVNTLALEPLIKQATTLNYKL